MENISGNEIDRAKYFLGKVSDNLLCPICSDVFTVPVFLKCCGKTLCNECWSKSMKNRTSCPMCRDTVPNEERSMNVGKNLVVDDCIQEMKVKCMHNKDPATCTCLWIGKLSEWKKHGSNDCELSVHACPISGCDFTGTRKELYNHNISNMTRHSDLLAGPKIAALESKHNRHKREAALNVAALDNKHIRHKKEAGLKIAALESKHNMYKMEAGLKFAALESKHNMHKKEAGLKFAALERKHNMHKQEADLIIAALERKRNMHKQEADLTITALERKYYRDVTTLKRKIDEQNVSTFSVGDIVQLQSRKDSKEKAKIVAVQLDYTYDVINTLTGRKKRCVKEDEMENLDFKCSKEWQILSHAKYELETAYRAMDEENFYSLVEDQERGIEEKKAALERAKSMYNRMKESNLFFF